MIYGLIFVLLSGLIFTVRRIRKSYRAGVDFLRLRSIITALTAQDVVRVMKRWSVIPASALAVLLFFWLINQGFPNFCGWYRTQDGPVWTLLLAIVSITALAALLPKKYRMAIFPAIAVLVLWVSYSTIMAWNWKYDTAHVEASVKPPPQQQTAWIPNFNVPSDRRCDGRTEWPFSYVATFTEVPAKGNCVTRFKVSGHTIQVKYRDGHIDTVRDDPNLNITIDPYVEYVRSVDGPFQGSIVLYPQTLN